MYLLSDEFHEALRKIPVPVTSPDWDAELKTAIPETNGFDPDYLLHVVRPAAQATVFDAGTPLLPMIDRVQTKRDALLRYFWGLLYENWKPETGQGSTVFLRAFEDRGPNNRRKKIFASALTPDLYPKNYRPKMQAFFDTVFAEDKLGKPFMKPYLEAFPELYWNLHLGVGKDEIPDDLRSIFSSFVAVFSNGNPLDPEFYGHYMNVREKRQFLLGWIKSGIDRIRANGGKNPDQTFVYYWIMNSNDSEDWFKEEDIVFECFTGFLAISQWPLATYLTIQQICNSDDTVLPKELATALEADRILLEEITIAPTTPFVAYAKYGPLGRFVMELFRRTPPNKASLSPFPLLFGKAASELGLEVFNSVSHIRACADPTLWDGADRFDPRRYLTVLNSAEIDDKKCRELGLSGCPFLADSMNVADGRNLTMRNSGFGTVYGVLDGQAMPVCDHAGYAPFGFGYRRCPGEQLTLCLFEDFLRALAERQLIFVKLDAPYDMVVVGPVPAVLDQYGFVKRIEGVQA